MPEKNTARQAPGPPDYYLLRHLRSASRDPIGFYESAWHTYGDFVRIHWFGPFAAHLAVHPDSVEHILQANWSNYTKGFFYKRLSIFAGQGLLTSQGDLWRRQRRLAQPAFHRQKVAAMTASMAATIGEMLDEWDRADLTQPVDLFAEMMRLALRIVARALFGADLDVQTAQWLHHQVGIGMTHTERRFNPLTLPESLPTPENKRFLKAKHELDSWILAMAERRRREGGDHTDLLQMLLDARDEETGEGMSDQQLVDEVITIMVAGHETSADGLAWCYSLLARNPETRAVLEAESDRVLGGRLPTFEDLALLPEAMQAFQEALRLYPPFWVMAREATADDEVTGYLVPARSTVIIPNYLVHRHPDFWRDPEKFDPQRFTPENSRDRHKFAYFPFGGGPRLCMGQMFALHEGQITLAATTGRYRVELVPEEKLAMHPSLTLRPRNGLWVMRHKRR